MTAIQLSQAEALLLTGVLGLPPLLGLGAEPSRAYAQGALQDVLAVAAGGLLARGYLHTLEINDVSLVAPEVAEFLRFSSYAEQTLLVTTHGQGIQSAIHFNNIGQRWLRHDSPQPLVHRFTWLAQSETPVNALISRINPVARVAHRFQFKITPAAFGMAISAIEQGELDLAQQALVTAGLSAAIAASFIHTLDARMVRYALLMIRGQTSAAPSGEPVIVLQSETHVWMCEETQPESAMLAVYPVDTVTFQARIERLITAPVVA